MLKLLDQTGLKRPINLRYGVPSAVSAVRVILAILLVKFTNGHSDGMLFAALVGVPIIMYLDAVDGIIARRFNSQSLLGSFIDIAADRLVEFIFILYFVNAGLVPLWFIVIFYGRIILTDACRMWAFRTDNVSAEGIVLPRPLRAIVLSKLSRSGYGALKGILFGLLFLTIYQQKTALSFLEFGAISAVVAVSLLRAAPILYTYFPWRISRDISKSKHLAEMNIVGRTTRVVSGIQLASDFCLAGILTFAALR